mmetsp:Transcript_62644/g.72867  ORF Transcript_62644/g.72867 Transcript_62644/m.72867 type:complete len:213 (+) Transcript_62644:3-641(+)
MITFITIAILLFTVPCSAELSKPQNDVYYSSVCIAKDREPRFCDMSIFDGCLCHNNGTCTSAWINKCGDCGREEVFAAIAGACPRVHPYLCSEGLSTLAKSTSKTSQKGCVCTKDGKCKVSVYDPSKQCEGENDLAFFPDMECPAESLRLIRKDNEIICTPQLRSQKRLCAQVIRDYGCVTFTDGTKQYVPVDDCTCQRQDVDRYLVNEECQ